MPLIGIISRSKQSTQFEIATLILVIMLIIFYIDAITPLGLTIWILYFIPLASTIYLEWKYAPITGAFLAIILLSITFFLSPRDTSEFFAIANRIFFIANLIVTAVLITHYNQNMEALIESEKRYRTVAEWSPDAILLQQGAKIIFINNVTLRLFGANKSEELLGKDVVSFVSSKDQENIRQKMNQALLGAKLEISQIKLVRLDGKDVMVNAWIGEILWERKWAVHIILRPSSSG
jgi:PAS domain S-box-containing protein